MEKRFEIASNFQPAGDQPAAIARLTEGLKQKRKHQVLLGVTGSGKTFTLANVIQNVQKPTLIIAHNKTLAAQLYEEFREFFPNNAVEYFVSYYDFYQPEAYMPSTNTYIEKDAQINEEIERMRHSATRSLLTRKDVIIVSSVSFIYGLGSPDVYKNLTCTIVEKVEMKRSELLRKLVDIQYQRNDLDFSRGTFRVRGDTVEIFPAYEEDRAIRVEFFGDFIETVTEVDPLRGIPLRKVKVATIYPASHYVTEAETRKRAIHLIQDELLIRLQQLKSLHKEAEYQRLEQRTLYDIEMMLEIGYCKGIENYSRHLTGRDPGDPPPTLMDYFPEDFLLVLDESHVTTPQLGAMYRGDRARKTSLVEFGFRLPSALDNRPLNFEEFEKLSEAHSGGVIYVSATPADYELAKTGGEIVEQIIRPTGLLDPVIHMRPAKTQVQDLVDEVKQRLKERPEHRILVTTLTKKSAEDLTTYMLSLGLRVKYLHSDIDTLDRIEILRDLRAGIFDILIGINLLREGLDLPEVSLVAILDADKEGFLRSKRSLIQTIGRAARNSEGTVILYADKMTDSIDAAVKETDRRRAIQMEYNKKHGVTPTTVIKAIGKRWDADSADDIRMRGSEAEKDLLLLKEFDATKLKSLKDVRKAIEKEQKEMLTAAREYRFEEAAQIRDRVKHLKHLELKLAASEL